MKKEEEEGLVEEGVLGVRWIDRTARWCQRSRAGREWKNSLVCFHPNSPLCLWPWDSHSPLCPAHSPPPSSPLSSPPVPYFRWITPQGLDRSEGSRLTTGAEWGFLHTSEYFILFPTKLSLFQEMNLKTWNRKPLTIQETTSFAFETSKLIFVLFFVPPLVYNHLGSRSHGTWAEFIHRERLKNVTESFRKLSMWSTYLISDLHYIYIFNMPVINIHRHKNRSKGIQPIFTYILVCFKTSRGKERAKLKYIYSSTLLM